MRGTTAGRKIKRGRGNEYAKEKLEENRNPENSKNSLPQDLMDEVDEELAELADLDDISNRSSACDCPAHVHDREFPLEIAKVELLMKSYKHV